MNRNIYTFNNLLRAYNRYRRKLANLRKANKNVRRQGILQNHIDRLYEKLMVLKTSVKLSTVAASVAIGTLAFAPQTAQGQIAFAPAQTNPFGLTDIGSVAAPTFADLDNDGDLDMLSGDVYGNFRYFQNTGTATAPAFVLAQTNPSGLTSIGQYLSPTFSDLDNDGDLDMLSGEAEGNFFYFQNTGTATAPVFAAAQTNHFGLTDIGGVSIPAFADLDNDGDLDIMAGEKYGNFFYFQNTSTTLSLIENDFGDAIKVYPNPTEDILIISTRSTMASVSLHNMLGQEVLNRKVNTNEEQIDVSLLAKGTYIVKVLTEDNKVNTSKLIKK